MPDFGNGAVDYEVGNNWTELEHNALIKHWMPQYHFCNPCHHMPYNLPTSVIHLEDFNNDAKCFLDSLTPKLDKTDYK